MPTITQNIGMQDFFTTTLSSAITDGNQLTIYLNNVPTETEGFLVLDYANSTKREIIFYNAVGANHVTCPADGRGQGNTTAQAHDLGADVRMNMVSGYFDVLKDGQLLGGQDWIQMSGSPAYASADSPTFTMTATGDITTKVYPGVRVKGTQAQALSHYWSFDSSSAADKGSATMGNIGTPTYTAGKFGNALTLNGTNQALSITDAAAFKPTGGFTLGCWFKTGTTGTTKTIFQSLSANTNTAGFKLVVESTNTIRVSIGNNTSGGFNSEYTGTTTVTDNIYHYVVMSIRNNWAQVYLDGKLEFSGYCVAPAYAATNYVRIGCGNISGTNNDYFNGQIDDLFLINGYALDEDTIAAKYAQATAQGTGDITVNKKFLCTASSYSAPNTTITMYGGTDYALSNSTIGNIYYSSQKAPYGFPIKEEKWSVIVEDGVQRQQASPVGGTYYNMGGVSLNVPIGSWRLGYFSSMHTSFGASTTTDVWTTLSTANNTQGERRFISSVAANSLVCAILSSRFADVSIPAKTTYYLNHSTTIGGAGVSIYLRGDLTPCRIYAISTLL